MITRLRSILTRTGTALVAVLATLLTPAVVNAQNLTLTSGGATYSIPVSSHYDATQTSNLTGVGTGDYLFEDGWWFRVSGDTQESFFPAPTTTTPGGGGDTGTVTWADVNSRGLFSATNTLSLTSTSAGTGVLVLTMSITNLSGSTPLTISLFHGADFDVNGTAAGDSPSLLSPNSHIRIQDSTAGFAEYKAFNPPADACLVRPFAATTDVFGLLGDTNINNFDNSGIPATNIDVTAAYQWNLVIPPGETRSVSVALAGNVPLSTPASAGDLIISEFRLRGPNGANDEFVEIYNNSGADHTVAGGGTGYALVASDGTARFVIPNGTVIPKGGHYLGVNSVGYSLASYPAGNGTTATGDATYTTDIPDNAGIALFNTSVAVDFTLANRLDAVGSTSEANTLYKEGTGYSALTPFSIDYAFTRRSTNNTVNDRTIALGDGVLVDTDNNTADFTFVDTNGTSAGAGQRLGAPGPENLSSPISTWPAAANIGRAFVDTGAALDATPNRIRDFTSNPANNSTFGTLELNRTFTNNTGAPLTRLRFRILKILTFPAASGFADLRPRTSTDAVVSISAGGGGGTKTVLGTTLEQPPSQPNGGGFNSSFSVPSVTLATPLAAGASVDVRFLFGIQQTGNYCLVLQPETLPGASDFWAVTGATDPGTSDATMFEGYSGLTADLSITKTDGVTTATPGGSVTYTITASNAGPDPVVGATVADTLPASLTGTWTGVGAGGGTCTASGSGNINDTVNLPVGGSVTYTVSCTISAAATGTLSNTATVSVPASMTDPVPGNNSATDSDTLTPSADLAITKTDGVTTVTPGGTVTYTITASNAGPSDATGATVADTFPASLTGVTWTGVGAGGGTCTASGSGNINDTVNLPAGGSVTYTVSGTVDSMATGTLSNTATVAAPGGVIDPTPGNNSATDTDTILAAPTVTSPTSTGITGTMATLGGNITSDGGSTITERGVVYSVTGTNADPLINGTGVTKLTTIGTTGVFSVIANSLSAGVAYSFKAFATNGVSTTYTTPVSTFTTLSNNADLSGLVVTTATLTPSFASATTAYTSMVPSATTSVTVTPSVAQASATVTVNTVAVTSGNASGAIPLSVGANVINVAVTAQDGVTVKTYTITITRAPSGTDLNNDGHADLVFQNSAGQIYAWYMDGAGAISSHGYLYPNLLTGWSLRGKGDLNNDGNTDLVFQDATGRIYVWYLDGAGAISSHGYISTTYLVDWRIAAIADMNADGNADLVFQNNAGQVGVWYMNGAGAYTSYGYINPNVLTGWALVGAADMDNDGNPDLVFQNDAGLIYVWYMNASGAITSHSYLSTGLLADWRIAAIADMNGDGNADLVFQNNAGQIGVWYMNGAGAYTSYAYLYPYILTDWRLR